MRTKKIEKGVYKFTNNYGETFILRGPSYLNSNYWIANVCKSLDECLDDNSSCIVFDTKKEIIKYLNK